MGPDVPLVATDMHDLYGIASFMSQGVACETML